MRGKLGTSLLSHNKMAAGTIARILLDCLSKENYRTSITGILKSSGFDYQDFINSANAEKYYLDTSLFNKQGHLNSNGMFELFAQFSLDSPMDVRENMVNMILGSKDTFAAAACVPLLLKKTSIDAWLSDMTKNTTPGDEIALFALCKIYLKHACVLTKHSVWTSIDLVEISQEDLIKKSDLVLLYMGEHMFGVLHPKASLSNPTNILSTVPYMGRRGQRKPVDLSIRGNLQRARGRELHTVTRRSRCTPRVRYPRIPTGRGLVNPIVTAQNPLLYQQMRGQRTSTSLG